MRRFAKTALVALVLVSMPAISHAQGRDPAGERGGRDREGGGRDRPDHERPDSGGRDRPDRAEAGTTSAPSPSFDRIQLSNPCGVAIWAAISYTQPNKELIVRGWFHVPPRQTILTDAISTGRTFYVYAYDDSQREWTGRSMANSRNLTVVFGAEFSGASPSLGMRTGAKVVSFIQRDTGEAWGTHTFTFGC